MRPKKIKKSILKTFLNFPQRKTHTIEIFCKVDSAISLKYKLYFNFASCFKMPFSIPQRTLKTFVWLHSFVSLTKKSQAVPYYLYTFRYLVCFTYFKMLFQFHIGHYELFLITWSLVLSAILVNYFEFFMVSRYFLLMA